MIRGYLKPGILIACLALCLTVALFPSGPSYAAEPVIVIENVAKTTITNTLNNVLARISGALSQASLQALTLKEYSLDTLAWNMGKQFLQQVTGDLIKFVNGGLNGAPAFVTNYSSEYERIRQAIVGQFISGTDLNNLCTERTAFEVKVLLLEDERIRNSSEQFQCTSPDKTAGSASTPKRNEITVIYDNATNCANDDMCGALQARVERDRKVLAGQTNVAQAIDNARGMKTPQTCRTVSKPDGSSKQECNYTQPQNLLSDTIGFYLGQLPALQLLNMDELNEVIGGLMANLTNQALTSFTGVLGLGGNSSFSNNIFGDDGSLSYADALAKEDITKYQSQNSNAIKEALTAETRYSELQREILDEIRELEDKLAENAEEFPSCFDFELTDELREAKQNATGNLNISSTTLAILKVLDSEYNSAADASAKNAVMSTFLQYQSQGLFRTEYENQELKVSYIDLEFAQVVDKFKYDTAVERYNCGGDFDYDGELDPPDNT